MSSKVTTRYLPEAEYPAWNNLVASSEEGSIYSSPEYLDVLCAETNGRFKILVAERGGEMVGGIALYERDARWGPYINGRLLLYYNGFILKPHASKYPSERSSRNLETLGALESAIVGNGYRRIRIKSRSAVQDIRVFQERGWLVHPSYTYVVPLTDMEGLWSRMEQNLRRLVKRCTTSEFRVTCDGDFDSFYRLHQQTHDRKGAAIYLPEEGFRRYFQRLCSQRMCCLFHARTPEGRVASTQLVLLGKHPVCHTVSAAADSEFLSSGATAFLRWKVFEHLAGMGFKGNDLTDAQLNPVTHFKSQLGGDLTMNLTLERPDRGGFMVETFAYRTGSLVKRGVRAVASTVRSNGKHE